MSSWNNAGFPDLFRFRSQTQCAEALASAICERSLAAGGNIRVTGDTFTTLDSKWLWEYWDLPFQDFLTTGLLSLAGCFCDPEKAYDFENYPELENWNADSLSAKLGKDYLEYTPFIDKDKWAMFVYRVLNLCHTKRVPVRQVNPRPVFSGTTVRYAYGTPDKVLGELKKKEFHYNDRENVGSSISAILYDDNSGCVEVTQHIGGFSTAYDPDSPCNVTFFGCPEKGSCDEFSALGARDVNGELIQENRWFCAGTAKDGDVLDTYVRKTLDFPDSELPTALPELTYGKFWKRGFELKILNASTDYICNAYAVCDYLKHFKYQIKYGEKQ